MQQGKSQAGKGGHLPGSHPPRWVHCLLEEQQEIRVNKRGWEEVGNKGVRWEPTTRTRRPGWDDTWLYTKYEEPLEDLNRSDLTFLFLKNTMANVWREMSKGKKTRSKATANNQSVWAKIAVAVRIAVHEQCHPLTWSEAWKSTKPWETKIDLQRFHTKALLMRSFLKFPLRWRFT